MKNKITVLVFSCILGFFFLISILKPERVFSSVENRYLQTKPNFSLHSLWSGIFSKDYETYLSDQFPFRNDWISMKSFMELCLGKKDIKNIYIGSDHYFIEKFSQKTFTSDQADRNLHNLSSFVQNSSQLLSDNDYGGSIKVMLVPTASEILKDKLPAFASPYPQSQFLAYAEQLIGKKYFFNLIPVLTAHKEEYLYYRTDHHWTSLGAFYGYQAWADSIGLSPYQPSDFRIQTVTDEFYGTLDSKIHLASVPDSMNTYTNLYSDFTLIYNQDGKIRTTMFDLSALKNRDKYQLYMGGNHAIVEISPDKDKDSPNAHLDKSRKLLVIKDSFANCFVPIAAGHFAYTALIDLRFYKGNLLSFIQEKGITDILVLYSTSNFATDKNTQTLIKSKSTSSVLFH